MDEEERGTTYHGTMATRIVANGNKLTINYVVQFGGTYFTLDINKAIELGLLIKED